MRGTAIDRTGKIEASHVCLDLPFQQRKAVLHVPLHRIHDRPRLVGRNIDADQRII
jgi:hypothetical protein